MLVTKPTSDFIRSIPPPPLFCFVTFTNGNFTLGARPAHTKCRKKLNFRRLISVTHSVRAVFFFAAFDFSQFFPRILNVFRTLVLSPYLTVPSNVLLAFVAFDNKSLHSTKYSALLPQVRKRHAYLTDTHIHKTSVGGLDDLREI